jgi:hypothetical protein
MNLEICEDTNVSESSNTLTKLVKDTFTNISQYMSSGNLINLLNTERNSESNTDIHLAVKDEIAIRINKQLLQKYFNTLKKYKALKMFEGTFLTPKFVNRFPIVEFADSFISRTDYIDNIKSKDMDAPIVIGLDRYLRPFIAIRYAANTIHTLPENDTTNYVENTEDATNACEHDTFMQLEQKMSLHTSTRVLIIFQRYTNDKQCWTKAGNCDASDPFLSCSSTAISMVDKKMVLRNISNLIDNEKITYLKYKSIFEDEYETITEEEVDCSLVV